MKYLFYAANLIFGLYFFLFALSHLLILIRPDAVRYFIFQNSINWPRDLTNPTVFGLHNVHNFYLDVSPSVRIGIWHYIPIPVEYSFVRHGKRNLKEHFDAYFKTLENRPIVIYSHGNDRDRSTQGRVQICQNLSNLGYHVFAVDYRGYGDSTGVPSETGAVEDIITLHNFIRSYQSTARIYLWGHSLGTGVSTHAAKVLSEFKSPPEGLILEAPFRNIIQAAREYIIAPLFYNNNWIIERSEAAVKEIGILFNNEENILKVNAKILLIHAEDDWFVPVERSRELLKLCEEKRPKDYPPVKLIELDRRFGLGHVKIYSHKEIYPLVKDFVDSK